jgi:hypothetical protein
MKIRTVGAEFFHADGRTDRQTDKRIGRRKTDRHGQTNSRFSQFCESVQNSRCFLLCNFMQPVDDRIGKFRHLRSRSTDKRLIN